MARVALQDVAKAFGNNRAIDGVSLTVDDGEFFVLLGPSGAGKTTTLSMIAGLESPDEGNIYLGDQSMLGVSPWNRDVAMAFESYALYPHMSVFDNMAFPLRAPSRSARLSSEEVRQRVQQVADMLQIGHLLDRRPSQLSGGQRQRTSLGRMLVRQPKVFLMDEPIVHLDAKLRFQMRGELKRLHEQFPTTTIYATPDWSEAVAMGHRIAVLHRGRVVQVGTPDEIYNRPVNRFVADFVGEPPMNILDGDMVRDDGMLKFGISDARVALDGALGRVVDGAGGVDRWQLGVRPNAVRLSRSISAETPIAASVFVSEPLGQDTVIETRVADQAVTAKVPGLVVLDPGTPVWLGIDPATVQLFDRKTGLAHRA